MNEKKNPWMTLTWMLAIIVVLGTLGFYTFVALNVYAMILFILMFLALIFIFSARAYRRR